MTVKDNLDEGKNIVDATVDPLVGLELLYPEAAKRFGGKGLQNALGRALSLGRVGAMMTPVGIGITALGLGKMGIEAAMDERERIKYDSRRIKNIQSGARRTNGNISIMDRRTFMKLLGGLASMPIVGRIAKPLKSETVQERYCIY